MTISTPPKEIKIPITVLPRHASGFQRAWIDEALNGTKSFLWIGYSIFTDVKAKISIKIFSGSYGHCENYPGGFYVLAHLLAVEITEVKK